MLFPCRNVVDQLLLILIIIDNKVVLVNQQATSHRTPIPRRIFLQLVRIDIILTEGFCDKWGKIEVCLFLFLNWLLAGYEWHMRGLKALTRAHVCNPAPPAFWDAARSHATIFKLLLILHDYLFMGIKKISINCTPLKLPRIQHQNLSPQRIHS